MIAQKMLNKAYARGLNHLMVSASLTSSTNA